MPGRVRRTPVAVGAAVEKGKVCSCSKPLKMEHSIPRRGAESLKAAASEGDLV